MGFYGNVSSSNKTAFSFDITYNSRTAMEAAAQTDGVFIGRYVLVEYDKPPISAYYHPTEHIFYNTNTFAKDTYIKNPIDGEIYLDLLQQHSANPFYQWLTDGTPKVDIPGNVLNGTGAYVKVNATVSPSYTSSYNIDVTRYGRGYDSTAWRKTYDVESGKYKYVLISELNTVVPNFHLIADPPANVPGAPYFDRDTTTNLDYFLHDQADWGFSVRSANKETKNEINIKNGEYEVDQEGFYVHPQVKDYIGQLSDETIVSRLQYWSQPDDFGAQTLSVIETDPAINGDIYYNKLGFNREERHITPYDPTKNGRYSIFKNTINYDIDHSGRLYYDTVALDGTWKNGKTQPDMMEWYIHLPILGDAVCELWDTLYGYDKNIDETDSHIASTEAAHRYVNLATKRGDTGIELIDDTPTQVRYISYSTDSALGAINEMRDMLGYAIKDLEVVESNGLSKIDNNGPTIADAILSNDSLLLQEAIDNVNYSFDKNDTMYLYFTRKKDTDPQQEVKEHFFAYTYNPIFERVEKKQGDAQWSYITDSTPNRVLFDDNDIYYLGTDNIYHKVNHTNYGITKSDGTTIDPISTFYAPKDRWKLTEVDNIKEDSVYGLITRLHELLGDTNPTLRTLDTIQGCINILKDMIANVDTQMQPHRLTMTNEKGQIVNMQEYDGQNFGNTVEYPYFASQDRQEILDCGGHWRLPISYKLESFNLLSNNQYFGQHWGNSVYHELAATDTIGEAYYKISEELSDIQYNLSKRIKLFESSVDVQKTTENITFNYIVDGKKSWQRIYYTTSLNENENSIATRTNKQAYLTGQDVAGIFTVAMGNEDLTVTLHVLDERNEEETQTLTIKHSLIYSYAKVNDLTDSSTQEGFLDKDINKFTITLGTGEYLYLQVPDNSYRLFIDGQYGGFDLYDDVEHIYRTTNAALGTIEIEIYK